MAFEGGQQNSFKGVVVVVDVDDPSNSWSNQHGNRYQCLHWDTPSAICTYVNVSLPLSLYECFWGFSIWIPLSLFLYHLSRSISSLSPFLYLLSLSVYLSLCKSSFYLYYSFSLSISSLYLFLSLLLCFLAKGFYLCLSLSYFSPL